MKNFKYLPLFLSFVILLQACSLPSVEPIEVEVNSNATLISLALTQTAVADAVVEKASSVIAMVSANTECRSGPGEGYNNLLTLPAGGNVTVIGKYTSLNPPYWIVQKDSIVCWLWGQYATLEGDISALPEMPLPVAVVPSGSPSPAVVLGTATLVPQAAKIITTTPVPPAAKIITVTPTLDTFVPLPPLVTVQMSTTQWVIYATDTPDMIIIPVQTLPVIIPFP